MIVLIDEKWDIRGVEELRKLFSKPRKGYWFMVDRDKALKICDILSRAYGISSPDVVVDILFLRRNHCNAMYFSYGYSPDDGFGGQKVFNEAGHATIVMYNRNHAKSIFHEFYHDLDYKTKGKYDSDDNYSGSSSYGWIFADILWNMILSGEGSDGIFEPDYKGFVSRVRELKDCGCPIDIEELSVLASKYKTPIPKDLM